MRRTAGWLCLGAAVALAGGCASSGSELSNRYGNCTFVPRTQCADQDLAAVSVPSSDLTDSDFSGADLRRADLRHAILRNANLAGADLSNADLTGADLRGANLAGARLFQATLTRANWVGAQRAGARYCETLLPDGGVSDCTEITGLEVPKVTIKPPRIESFAPRRPVRCIYDGAGGGIEIDWKVRDGGSASFLVDDIQVSTAAGDHGIKRIPFPCDDQRHTVSIQAFGALSPLATSSFSLTLGRGDPSAPIR